MLYYRYVAAAAAKSRQLCPTLCDPIDATPPGSRPWDSPGKNTGVGCHFLLPTAVFLPGESQGREPGGLLSMGSHRVGHN